MHVVAPRKRFSVCSRIPSPRRIVQVELTQVRLQLSTSFKKLYHSKGYKSISILIYTMKTFTLLALAGTAAAFAPAPRQVRKM